VADLPKLEKVMDRIDGLPIFFYGANTGGDEADYWDQEAYWGEHGYDLHVITDEGVTLGTGEKCGTACCFAGWTAVLFAPPGTIAYGPNASLILPGQEHWTAIGAFAEEILELTPNEAFTLFSAGNTKEDLHAIIDRLREKYGEH
jgi:hypothetical protein